MWCCSAFAAACTEVELDVLTGERQVLRADILYDSGASLNPAVDIGQVGGCMKSLQEANKKLMESQ